MIGVLLVILLHLFLLWGFFKISSYHSVSSDNENKSTLLLLLTPIASPVSKIRPQIEAHKLSNVAPSRHGPQRIESVARPDIQNLAKLSESNVEKNIKGIVVRPLDIDAIKNIGRTSPIADGNVIQGPAKTLCLESKLATGLEEGKRPKCDNNYKAKIGQVEFKGLMKIPFLVKNGITDTGCKW